jgi:hypothetical protein
MALEYPRCAIFIAFTSCSLPSDTSIHITMLSSDEQTIIKQHNCNIGTGSQALLLLLVACHVKSLSDYSEQMFSNIVWLRERESVWRKQNKAVNLHVTYYRAFVQLLLQWESKIYYIFWVCLCSLRYPACNAHAPYCHTAQYFPTLSYKRHDFR